MQNALYFIFVILFLIIIFNQKLSNALLFLLLAPLMVLTGILDASTVWGFFANSSVLLMLLIGVYSYLMSIAEFDDLIGETFERMTKALNLKGKNYERGLYGIVFVLVALCSTVMQNASVTMAMVPALYGISRRMNISRSKLVLFAIYASTLGGACTLIGTDTNIYANAALEEAGIATFGMFDFAWVGVPIAIAAGCGYLTPFASGTNQRMSVFGRSTIVDYMRFGWPLMVITYVCAVLILPRVFPFF